MNPKSKIKAKEYCHLDPDLRKEVLSRKKGWRPLFGQSSAAQGHLSNKKIGKGDLFLFFGWFKEAELVNGKIRYKKGAPHQNIIWGYLEIGEIFNLEEINTVSKLPKWAQYHSHAQKDRLCESNNRIYCATKTLSFAPSLHGGGCLNFHEDLILTKQGYSRSKWDLSALPRKTKISYGYFEKNYFQSPARGQELVIEENPEVTKWAKKIIRAGVQSEI